jgi:hypothetical protein
LGYVGATGIASTSVVTAGDGHTGGTSGQPSSNDHTGVAGLPDTSQQTHTISHLVAATLSSAHLRPTAIADPSWRLAMEEEYDALITNKTWDLVPQLVSSNIIIDKWIFVSVFCTSKIHDGQDRMFQF